MYSVLIAMCTSASTPLRHTEWHGRSSNAPLDKWARTLGAWELWAFKGEVKIKGQLWNLSPSFWNCSPWNHENWLSSDAQTGDSSVPGHSPKMYPGTVNPRITHLEAQYFDPVRFLVLRGGIPVHGEFPRNLDSEILSLWIRSMCTGRMTQLHIKNHQESAATKSKGRRKAKSDKTQIHVLTNSRFTKHRTCGMPAAKTII